MNSNTENSTHHAEFYHFNSSIEMDRFKLERNLNMSDLERFRMFLSLMKMGKRLKNAPKIHKTIS